MESKQFENPLTNSEGKEKYDDEWYLEFQKYGSFEAPNYLDGDRDYRENQKKMLLEGTIENPNLDYPKLDMKKIEMYRKGLCELRDRIKKEEKNPIVSQVYRWKINEKLAEIKMLHAVSEGDMRNFKRYAQFIYGKLDPEIFTYTVETLRKKIEGSIDDLSDEAKDKIKDLIRIISEGKEKHGNFELPDEETVNRFRDITIDELGKIINVPEKNEKFNADEIKAIFEEALINLDAQGWKVVIDESSRKGIMVTHEEKKVKVPESRKLLSDKLRGLVAHEIGTHVARREKGERSKLMLLGLGLDRYLPGEEGISTSRQQAVEGQMDDFAGFNYYFLMGLADGLNDGKPKTFREVFEIAKQYHLFENLLKNLSEEESLTKAQNSAWNNTVRIFRGTDCKTPGVYYPKDQVYRQGNIGIWNLVKDKPEEAMKFSLGKFDPMNPRHLWILSELGITEEDLEEMEKEERIEK